MGVTEESTSQTRHCHCDHGLVSSNSVYWQNTEVAQCQVLPPEISWSPRSQCAGSGTAAQGGFSPLGVATRRQTRLSKATALRTQGPPTASPQVR